MEAHTPQQAEGTLSQGVVQSETILSVTNPNHYVKQGNFVTQEGKGTTPVEGPEKHGNKTIVDQGNLQTLSKLNQKEQYQLIQTDVGPN